MALLGCASWAAGHGQPPSTVVALVAAAFLPYAVLCRHTLDPDPARALLLGAGLAALAGLALVAAPPVLSDDLWRYLWDGRVLGHGLDPYAWPPSDPALAPLRDALHARINNVDLPTLYPPLAEILFALADRLGHAAWSPKLLALGAHLATAPLVGRLAPRAAPLFVLNPLALEEAALGGHVDAFAALFLVAGVLALGRGAARIAGLALAAATGIKLVGLALAPLFLRSGMRHRGSALAIVALAGGLSLGAVGSAGHAAGGRSGLGHYTARWRGNDGGFAVLTVASRGALDLAALALAGRAGSIDLPPALARLLRGGPLDPDGLRGPKKALRSATMFSTRALADRLARLLAVLVVLAVGIRHARLGTAPLRASRDVVLALLLVAPQVHPWYLAWLLPLEIASGGTAGLVWSAAILVAYAPLDAWAAHRIWRESLSGRALEYALVAAAMLHDVQRSRRGAIEDRDPLLATRSRRDISATAR